MTFSGCWRSHKIFNVDTSNFPIQGLTFAKSKINFVMHDVYIPLHVFPTQNFMCFMVALEILIIFCFRYVYIYIFDGSVLGILELARCILSIWLLILRLYKDSINLKIVNISSYPSNLWIFFFYKYFGWIMVPKDSTNFQ